MKQKLRYIIYIPGMGITKDVLENKSLGGSESSGFYLARELTRQGNDVAIFTNIEKDEMYEDVILSPIGPQSDKFKLGENFERSASTSSFDVLIMQRVPNAFYKKFNNKVNLYWLHDLSIVRNRDGIKSTLWNCDGILVVSEFHKKQVCENIGLPDNFVHIVRNGVSEHFVNKVDHKVKWEGKNIIYTSRPERGLENALDIMEGVEDKSITLHICGYDNTTTQMAPFYNDLWRRCREASNVELHGPLTKQQLADLFDSCFLHLYPVIESSKFEEVSCIAVMEAQATGTPVLACRNGALPETLKNRGVEFVDYKEDGNVDIDKFIESINLYCESYNHWSKFYELTVNGELYSYKESAQVVEELVFSILSCSSPLALIKHFLHHSDYFAAKKIATKHQIEHPDLMLYDFVEKEEYAELYENINQYCKDDNNTHNIGNDETVLKLPRFDVIVPHIADLNIIGSGKVLDYGCCIGQLTLSLARNFKNLEYCGVDISEGNIDQANEYKKKFEIDNVHYFESIPPDSKYDLIICSEVMEHIPDPKALTDELESYLTDNGKVVITVPFGPVESIRYGNFPYREHIHHYEYQDIEDIWGKKKNFNVTQFTWGESTIHGEPVGGSIIVYNKGGETGTIDYARKEKQNPRQTLSVCMIVRESEIDKGLRKTLDSVKDIADEIILGVDGRLDNYHEQYEFGSISLAPIEEEYNFEFFELTESPLVQGFDSARNETLEKATCDWILWIDADEILQYPERLLKYLRNSPYQGYSIKQNHFSSEPLQVLKVDLPLRLFRRNTGFKFFGRVHEHPSLTSNDAPKYAMVIPDFWIDHSYSTEALRRKKFTRNIDLMKKDREDYPDRPLGKMLWIRDLMHLAQFQLEQTGVANKDHAEEAFKVFDELIENKEMRFLVESFGYISMASNILKGPEAIDFKFALQGHKMGITSGDMKPMEVKLPDVEYVKKLTSLLVEEHTNVYQEKYF